MNVGLLLALTQEVRSYPSSRVELLLLISGILTRNPMEEPLNFISYANKEYLEMLIRCRSVMLENGVEGGDTIKADKGMS